MRVAILTFHFNYNYGALLQARATAAILRQMGHEPVFPNYIPPFQRASTSYWRGFGIRSCRIISSFRKKVLEITKRRKFDEYRSKKLEISEPLSSKKEVSEFLACCDCALVGSDQVWNLDWMNGFDGYYFLEDLPEGCATRRVAYAACFGHKNQREERFSKASGLLQKFDFIGVRNRTSYDLVSRVPGCTPSIVPDPTLLYDYKEDRGESVFHSKAEGQIVVYCLDPENIKKANEVVCALKRKQKLCAYVLPSDAIGSLGSANSSLVGIGPSEWMSAIGSASWLVTDSFHGYIFALKYGVKSIVITKGWRSERLTELISRTDTDYALLKNEDIFDRIACIDSLHNPEKVMRHLADVRVAGFSFINKALSKI